MSGKHLEALGQRLLRARGSSSSSGTVVKLMRAESGVLPHAPLLCRLGPPGLQIAPKDKYVSQKELRSLTKCWGGETWGPSHCNAVRQEGVGRAGRGILPGSELHKF